MWLVPEAQVLWAICYEFKRTPSEVLGLGLQEYLFLVSGLERHRQLEKEAMDNARH